MTGNVAGLAAKSGGGVIATGRFSSGPDVLDVDDALTPLAGYEITGLPTPVMVLADGAPAVLGGGLWRWDGTWKQVTNASLTTAVLPDADGGIVFATWMADAVDEVTRWSAGGVESLGTLPASPVRLGVLDGELVALAASQTYEVWMRHDGAWGLLPSPDDALWDLIVSPVLGLVVTGERATWRWDGAGWQMLAATGGQARACSDGVLTVDHGIATFTDGTTTATIQLPDVNFFEIEPAHDGLYIGRFGDSGASIRRFGL